MVVGKRQLVGANGWSRLASAGCCVVALGVLSGCGGAGRSTPTSTVVQTASPSSTQATSASTTAVTSKASPRAAEPSRPSSPSTTRHPVASTSSRVLLSTTAQARRSTCATYPGSDGMTIDPCIRRDANGFALGGPPYPASPANYQHPTAAECVRFRSQLRAWSNFQNAHRPPGATSGLPSSGDVQYLFIYCHLKY